jgi:small multidrug resistance family-3 protein
MSPIARSVALFLFAGLAEIGGGYLLWRWLREGGSIVLGIGGAALLVVYGIIPTLQPSTFGRTYTAYGGVFVVLSLLWGWWIDGHRPDMADVVGGIICVMGVSVIMYWPRTPA